MRLCVVETVGGGVEGWKGGRENVEGAVEAPVSALEYQLTKTLISTSFVDQVHAALPFYFVFHFGRLSPFSRMRGSLRVTVCRFL